MTSLDDWFPYAHYRPHQWKMLEIAAACGESGGIAMIDAPTGSGKSSVVSALLSVSRGRKVIVAVRTVSQLTTFLRELQLIREKRGDLKFAYLIGKGNMCPLGGEGDVYRRCEGVKAFSSALMRERADSGAVSPAKDPLIRQQIRRIDREHPLICPYYIHSRSYAESADSGMKMIPSRDLRTRAGRVSTEVILPEHLSKFCGDVCPYETMLHAAREADVVILNFHHLFNDAVREQIYLSLGIEAADTLLLVDEAHNCGDVVQSIESVVLQEKDIELAGYELRQQRQISGEAEGIAHILPQIRAFMEMLKGSRETEDWFDPAIFTRLLLRESLYKEMDRVVDDLLAISEKTREKNKKAGEFRETAIERLTTFMYRIFRSAADPAFLTVYRRDEEEGVSLEVRNIDPSTKLQEIAQAHGCCVFISGSLSPVKSYCRYYFGDELPVTTISLPNSFPKRKRLLLCARDITSTYTMRRDRQNIQLIRDYISTFTTLPGNLAVYFPSYEMLNTFADESGAHIRGKEVFAEPRDAGGAGIALKKFMNLPQQGRSGVIFAVCGGKWSEGLDYRGEMLSGALVVGLPLAPYNRVRRMVINYFKNKFGSEGEFISYTLPAVNRAVQALGRVLRTPDDRGVLVLGERRFLEPRIGAGLPPWMQEEMTECTINTFREAIRRWR